MILGRLYVSVLAHTFLANFETYYCSTSNITVSFWLSICAVAFLNFCVTATKLLNVNVCQMIINSPSKYKSGRERL